MPQRLNETQFTLDNFDKFYEHHDFTPIPDEHCIDANRFIPRFGWAVDVAKELKPKTVLDLGCLDGSLILSILNHLPTDTKGTGIDLTMDGIELATKRASLHGFNADFIQSDIESWMEKCTDKFDLITCFEVMEHVKDTELVIKLIDKVLAPGGTVLISTPDFESPTYGYVDTINKCHIRLFTLADADYDKTFVDMQPNSDNYGKEVTRTATSLSKLLKVYNVLEMETLSELINCRYTR